MVSGFLTALQPAVLAIENELGIVVARNCVRANGGQTIADAKTFRGAAAASPQARRRPLVWRACRTPARRRGREADNSGGLGMALDPNDHNAGVISVANSAVTPGTRARVTVDAKGRPRAAPKCPGCPGRPNV
jgi:hypothetical protein